jgi:hypothetical protein
MRVVKIVRALGIVVFCVLPGAPARAVVVNSDWTLGDSAAAAAAPLFENIGWIQITEGPSTYRGTGVLVASDWVLTAAHNWLTDEVTALSFNLGGVSYQAANGQWYQHPGWAADPQVGPTQGWDIALFQLSIPVPGVSPVTLYSGSGELGASLFLGGYGLAGTAATGPRPNPVPTLYAAQNTVDRVVSLTGPDGAGGLLLADFDDGTGTRNSLAGSAIYSTTGGTLTSVPNGTISAQSSSASFVTLEGTTASGDSGGPAFADFGSGYELVGLTSWGVNPTQPGNLYGSGYGDATYFTRVSPFVPWIAATIPEPSTYLLVLLGAGALYVWKLRKIARR